MIAPYFEYDSRNKVVFIRHIQMEDETKSNAMESAFKYCYELRDKYGYNLQITI